MFVTFTLLDLRARAVTYRFGHQSFYVCVDNSVCNLQATTWQHLLMTRSSSSGTWENSRTSRTSRWRTNMRLDLCLVCI